MSPIRGGGEPTRTRSLARSLARAAPGDRSWRTDAPATQEQVLASGGGLPATRHGMRAPLRSTLIPRREAQRGP